MSALPQSYEQHFPL